MTVELGERRKATYVENLHFCFWCSKLILSGSEIVVIHVRPTVDRLAHLSCISGAVLLGEVVVAS